MLKFLILSPDQIYFWKPGECRWSISLKLTIVISREINLLKKCYKQKLRKWSQTGLPEKKVGDSCSRDLQNSTWDRFRHLDSFHIKWKLTSEQLCFLSLLTDAMRQCSCVDISVGKHFPDSVELQRQVLASAPSLQEIDLRLSALFWQIPDYTITLYSIIV